MRALSHSQITLYLQCPLKYKFKYIDGLKEKPRSYLSFGKSVHGALEFLFGSKFQTPPSQEEVLVKYTKVWIKEGYKDKKEEDQYLEYGKSIIKGE
ncbi:MAG: PD-(D/E)XK nuclease family protein [Candidatus Omnitrophica bacterium]|nr:PD-(D/E)XK nuclease family protein [Candidatus Omnitrophota bacterium]